MKARKNILGFRSLKTQIVLIGRGKMKFSLRDFKQIARRADQMKYCSDRLGELGGGSARIVFKLTPRYVLKLAFNDRGVDQNKTEVKVSSDPKYSRILAKVHQHAEDFSWVISDLVRPIRDEEDFQEVFGMRWEEFIDAVRGRGPWHMLGGTPDSDEPIGHASYNPANRWDGPRPTTVGSRVGTYRYVNSLHDLVKSKKLHDVELADIGHWGKTSDGRLVILDYGVDNENWKQQTIYAENQQNTQDLGQGFMCPNSTKHSELILEASFQHKMMKEHQEEKEEILECLRELVVEIVRKCGSDWCLYTKKKGSDGKRRRLGTHRSKKDANRQEIAIQYSKHRG